MFDYAFRVLKVTAITRRAIRQELRLHPAYMMNSRQQRQKFRSRKQRPIIVNNLGSLHCDIGFYAVTRDGPETPLKYRSGFLVGVDVLSKYIYVHILNKNRKAPSMIAAFEDVLRQFRSHNFGQNVASISFDKERSVMSNQVQHFFKENNISFHAFQFSDSKAKLAENAIGLIRTEIARLKIMARVNNKKLGWWQLIGAAVTGLNKRPIRINGKFILKNYHDATTPFYAVKDIRPSNVDDYIAKAKKADVSYYFSQFEVDPRLTKFQFNINDIVRPKIISISSEVIGTKRSEITVADDSFIIEKRSPYISRALTIEQMYQCKNLKTGEVDYFHASDIVLTQKTQYAI